MPSIVTRKGRVTIPKPIRDHLAIAPGSQVVFEITPEGVVILRASKPGTELPGRFEKAVGMADIKMRTDEIMRLLRPDD
ncbi:AbrB/MazE/SpoVT family DNA-binding domain-containing protein [Sabulicella glaciei]|uniref:AbrB/MazE/SpoVT family DNA-binding domain-containing protein n=1 Tax=Sabulicella glaciei TaxID=2984948 RepID=A0ABT3P1E5_9PROT|nr:AbrB/MazE/SpoVT family DNA-binding domain-containing protein [Roseococcus sp. MDT2-1-1]MCW8088228.1 AbrB/MazE/SpoVT family DNA-binding domain-containing protein [Roseococcus sp. MDT2-1-1]